MEETFLEQPAVEEIDLLEVLKSLGDPVRLVVLGALADGELHSCSPEILGIDVHKSTLSHHLKVLREAGVTSTVQSGRTRGVRLRREDLDARFPGLVDGLLSGVAMHT